MRDGSPARPRFVVGLGDIHGGEVAFDAGVDAVNGFEKRALRRSGEEPNCLTPAAFELGGGGGLLENRGGFHGGEVGVYVGGMSGRDDEGGAHGGGIAVEGGAEKKVFTASRGALTGKTDVNAGAEAAAAPGRRQDGGGCRGDGQSTADRDKGESERISKLW